MDIKKFYVCDCGEKIEVEHWNSTKEMIAHGALGTAHTGFSLRREETRPMQVGDVVGIIIKRFLAHSHIGTLQQLGVNLDGMVAAYLEEDFPRKHPNCKKCGHDPHPTSDFCPYCETRCNRGEDREENCEVCHHEEHNMGACLECSKSGDRTCSWNTEGRV